MKYVIVNTKTDNIMNKEDKTKVLKKLSYIKDCLCDLENDVENTETDNRNPMRGRVEWDERSGSYTRRGY